MRLITNITKKTEENIDKGDMKISLRVKGKGKGKAEHLYSALHGTNHFKALRHGSHSF